ncbi:hypothetical protein CEXT_747891 [Caerostris extrusa]|uniref:Uncharacterized protein n=1 Tax=Caerostris extrusa TaxID=172846 RepID=A0AAV4T903_CAEEX|nr:hypothetical protein CEXT_747891 [Caerostris extrusa]
MQRTESDTKCRNVCMVSKQESRDVSSLSRKCRAASPVEWAATAVNGGRPIHEESITPEMGTSLLCTGRRLRKQASTVPFRTAFVADHSSRSMWVNESSRSPSMLLCLC